MNALDPWTLPLSGTSLIEASAGTGKTYTLTGSIQVVQGIVAGGLRQSMGSETRFTQITCLHQLDHERYFKSTSKGIPAGLFIEVGIPEGAPTLLIEGLADNARIESGE